MLSILSSQWLAPIALLIFCFFLFGDILLGFRPGVISDAHGDLSTQFYYWRDFGFEQLRHGRIAQWNPYVYGGVPFFSGWQSAILYPLNWIYLFVPLNQALTLDAATSVYLVGLFTSLFARRRGMRPIAQLAAGAIVMCGGGFYPHAWAGHLSMLAAMAWVPLVLLAVDWSIDSPGARPILLGGFAVAMQVLAGHPQTVYYTALVLLIYAAARLISASNRMKAFGCLMGIAVFGGALSAVQMLPGVFINDETTRAGQMNLSMATSIALPPANYFTLLAPHVFGDLVHVDYWGRSLQWEVNIFVGSAVILLSVLGVASGKDPRGRLWAVMAVVCFLLSMGSFTPFFDILYNHLPFFGKFRGQSKFTFDALLFIGLLAGSGLDAVLSENRDDFRLKAARIGALVMGVLTAVMALTALWASVGDAGLNYVVSMSNSPNSFAPLAWTQNSVKAEDALNFGLYQLAFAALSCALAGAFAWLLSKNRRWGYAITVMALIQLFVFARSMTTVFDPAISAARPGQAALDGERVLTNGLSTNRAILTRQGDIWGYDPMVVKRYSELMFASQGRNPKDAGIGLKFGWRTPVLDLFRCGSVIQRMDGHLVSIRVGSPLPHALLIGNWEVRNGRDNVLKTVLNSKFDIRHDVVLEADPKISQAPRGVSPTGKIQVVWLSSDTLDVRVESDTPAMLLITDTYSRFFKAIAQPDSDQKQFRVMPANWAQLSVPIEGGRSHFLLRYIPPFFREGAIISIAAWILFAVGVVFVLCRRRLERS